VGRGRQGLDQFGLEAVCFFRLLLGCQTSSGAGRGSKGVGQRDPPDILATMVRLSVTVCGTSIPALQVCRLRKNSAVTGKESVVSD